MRERLVFLLPPLLLLCIALPQLGDGEFRRDTVRYAAVGEYMFESGDPLAPLLRPGVPYFNKPPLALWIHGASMGLLGGGLAAARLPSVFAAAGIVLLTMLCARRLAGKHEAVISGLLLVFSYEFTRRTREISLDLWMLLLIMAATYLAIVHRNRPSPWRAAGAGALLGLALLTKPLIALGVPLLWLPCFYRGATRWQGAKLLGISYTAALAVALPWHLYMVSRFGEEFVGQYFGNQIVGRAKGQHGEEGLLYYLTISEYFYLPWLLAGLAVWVSLGRQPWRRRNPGLLFPGLFWATAWLVALSLFADKKPNYLLPAWPGLAWAGAYGLVRVRVPGLTRWHGTGYRWLSAAAVSAACIVALLPIEVQKGAPPGSRPVLDALDGRGVPITAVAAAGLLDNDYCYIYLHTGSWPLADPSKASYLLNRRRQQHDAELVFHYDRYHLWKLGDAPGPPSS